MIYNLSSSLAVSLNLPKYHCHLYLVLCIYDIYVYKPFNLVDQINFVVANKRFLLNTLQGGGGSRRRKKENDFKQLGEGYDETDPFIDNSDAVSHFIYFLKP